MNEKMNTVPDIITGKDLDYLSDMFNWNYECLKKTNEAINNTQDEQIVELLSRACDFFDSNLGNVLAVLQGGQNE